MKFYNFVKNPLGIYSKLSLAHVITFVEMRKRYTFL